MNPGAITLEMIEGAQIIDLHETYELSDDGLDTRIIYFTTDRDFTFTAPFAGAPWETCEVPDEADQLEDEVISYSYKVVRRFLRKPRFVEEPSTVIDTVKQIKARRIAGVYCGAYDESLEFHYPPDGVIVFEDGSQAANNMVAPHGTGAAGLYFHESDEVPDLPDKVDYFTIPLDQPAGQGGADQPATAPESKPEGDESANPESEGNSQ